jgi:hypothetical protein
VNASARQALADQSALWIAANSPGKLVLGVDVFSDWEPKFRNLLRGIPGASALAKSSSQRSRKNRPITAQNKHDRSEGSTCSSTKPWYKPEHTAPIS